MNNKLLRVVRVLKYLVKVLVDGTEHGMVDGGGLPEMNINKFPTFPPRVNGQIYGWKKPQFMVIDDTTRHDTILFW